NAIVPTVDLANGRVVIERPNEIAGDEPDADLSERRPRESGDP
ncbi:MAG: 16S rRNA processing protein RimM, partial [Bradyrhizobium sp.]|nr:16S rRNA processing protein RimM [Bradyrhizobium sp.]